MKFPKAKPASPATRALEVVPPSGPTAWLTTFTAGAMTFLLSLIHISEPTRPY